MVPQMEMSCLRGEWWGSYKETGGNMSPHLLLMRYYHIIWLGVPGDLDYSLGISIDIWEIMDFVSIDINIMRIYLPFTNFLKEYLSIFTICVYRINRKLEFYISIYRYFFSGEWNALYFEKVQIVWMTYNCS